MRRKPQSTCSARGSEPAGPGGAWERASLAPSQATLRVRDPPVRGAVQEKAHPGRGQRGGSRAVSRSEAGQGEGSPLVQAGDQSAWVGAEQGGAATPQSCRPPSPAPPTEPSSGMVPCAHSAGRGTQINASCPCAPPSRPQPRRTRLRRTKTQRCPPSWQAAATGHTRSLSFLPKPLARPSPCRHRA